MVIFVCAWYFKMLIPMLIWCVMFLMLRNYIGGLLLINIFTEPVIHDENSAEIIPIKTAFPNFTLQRFKNTAQTTPPANITTPILQ